MNRRVLPSKPKRKAKRSDDHSSTRLSPLLTLAVTQPEIGFLTSKHCLKCQGWLIIQEVTLAQDREIRCLNCGWQPQYSERFIQETEEARLFRRFTGNMFCKELVQQIDFSKSTRSR